MTLATDIKYFTTDENEKYLEIPTTEDLCKIITTKIDGLYKNIEYLEAENKQLKDEAYSSSEMKTMKEELEQMEKDYYRGFPISEEENDKIQNWIHKHDEEKHHAKNLEDRLRLEGVSGGRFTYRFVPTTLGTIGYLRCSCGDEFCFKTIN